jgi:hypothetical protein
MQHSMAGMLCWHSWLARLQPPSRPSRTEPAGRRVPLRLPRCCPPTLARCARPGPLRTPRPAAPARAPAALDGRRLPDERDERDERRERRETRETRDERDERRERRETRETRDERESLPDEVGPYHTPAMPCPGGGPPAPSSREPAPRRVSRAGHPPRLPPRRLASHQRLRDQQLCSAGYTTYCAHYCKTTAPYSRCCCV